jgi:hypothetical protein
MLTLSKGGGTGGGGQQGGGGMGGVASKGKDRARGGDGRGTSQWPKVMSPHINAYPGSERNGYTLV